MFCPNCGSSVSGTVKFCGHCGKALYAMVMPKFPKRFLKPLLFLATLILLLFAGLNYVVPLLTQAGFVNLPFVKGSISGTVYKTDGKTPFAGVDVRYTDVEKIKTDANGKFYFFDVPVGTYTLYAEKEGHEQSTQKVTVASNKTAESSMTLPIASPAPGSAIIAEKISSQGQSEVWMMNTDGTNKRKIVEGSNPEIVDSRTEIIVTRSGKRYQVYLDGSGEQLVGVASNEWSSGEKPSQKGFSAQATSPDMKHSAMVDNNDIWVIRGDERIRLTSMNDPKLRDVFWIDNENLVFRTGKDYNTIINRLNINTKEVKELYNDSFTVVWSYTYENFAAIKYTSPSCSYCSDEEKGNVAEKSKRNGIWIYKIADGSSEKIAENNRNIYRNIQWLPGHEILAFTISDPERETEDGLYVYDSRTTNGKSYKIADTGQYIDFSNAAWSINEESLVTQGGYLVRFDGSQAKRITEKRAQFNWLPSNKIIFTLNEEKSTWVTTNGEDQKKISDMALDLTFSLSPDKKNIITDTDGYVWLLDGNGENLRQITTESGWKNPLWL